MTRRLYPKMVLFLLLLTIMVLSMPSSVFAAQWQRVNVLVAYDEEWESTAFWTYGYEATTLAYIIISEVSDRFYVKWCIEFHRVSYTFWDSDDNPANADVMMNEAISETGFETGMTIGYYVIDVLIAFTDQRIPGCWGYSDSELGVVLVRHAYPAGVGQATDNILQHELSHLYDAPDEDVEDLDCVMNGYPYYIGFPYFYAVPTALTTTNWCEGCLATIRANVDNWGRLHSGTGGSTGMYRMLY